MMAAFMTVSCGKNDNSSGSGGSGSNAGISDYTQSQAYGSIDQVRQAFSSKSIAMQRFPCISVLSWSYESSSH